MPQHTSTSTPSDRRNHHRSSREHIQKHPNTVRTRPTEPTIHPDHQAPLPPPSSPPQPSAVTTQPFHRLATAVKHCPWALGSGPHPLALTHAPDPGFYPPVPRSLTHDAAVSFVVTDQTRPEQPQFVICCPLEHVGLVQEVLAPAGSQRLLSARGSSGRPRDGAELRSMLLDGTPNIELTLQAHAAPAPAAAPGASTSATSGGGDRGGGAGDEGSASTRRNSYCRVRPGDAWESSGNGYGVPPPWVHGAGGPQLYPPLSFATPHYYTS